MTRIDGLLDYENGRVMKQATRRKASLA